MKLDKVGIFGYIAIEYERRKGSSGEYIKRVLKDVEREREREKVCVCAGTIGFLWR